MAVSQKDKIFVVLQVLVMIAWLFKVDALDFVIPENLHKMAIFLAVIGLGIVVAAVFQLRKSLSPFPTPREGAKLITSGVFEFARHPIYSGILFITFGISIWLGSGFKLLMSLLLYLLFYLKSSYEEQLLIKAFPEYVHYKRNTGRFFPKFKGRI